MLADDLTPILLYAQSQGIDLRPTWSDVGMGLVVLLVICVIGHFLGKL